MFKVLVLQALYALSDDQTEYQLRDRVCFMRFVGLGLHEPVPNAKTIWLFREQLTRVGAVERLFRRFDAALRDKGVLAMGGQAVHAAFAKSYSKATIKGCAKEVEEGETVYEIGSMEGETGRDVLFHADGMVIVVEETIAVGNVPDPVQQAVHKMYPDGAITLAEKIMRDATVLYEFRVKDHDTLEEIVFDNSGTEVEHKSGTEVEQ